MKERFIPTQDLKTGFKVFSIVSRSVYEEVKPDLQRYMTKRYVGFVRSFKKSSL